MAEKERFSLKDELFNQQKVQYLAGLLKAADKSFDAKGFEREVMKTLLSLELKARLQLIATTLDGYLDPDFRKASQHIIAALPEPLDPTKTDNDFGDFIFAPLGEYVVQHGLSKKHFKTSLKTLKKITQRFSMEDAIRFYINEFPKETLVELKKWSTDKNYHVRRLVSEGTRPLLPWSGRISIGTKETLPLLDTLHADPTRYVTRSVANHLNDIAKSDPDTVITTFKRWQKAGKQNKKELEWMTKHALRTLIKQGHPGALALIGYHTNPAISVSKVASNKKTLRRGEVFEFSFSITAAADEKLLIDYVVDFKKARGSAPKVFKITQTEIKKGETKEFSKRHFFKADATTFKLYPGQHTITLQINGKQYSSVSFTLT
ncbi:MAG: hypothetical protein AAGA35_03180 [Patescibacteria group bacterium]